MLYDYKKSNVPNTLAQIKKQIKRFKNKAKKNCQHLYGKLNKNYKKLDWNKKRFITSEIKDVIQDQNFKRWRRIKADKDVAIIKEGKNYYVQRQNLQGLCLLRQICCQLQDDYLSDTKENKKYKSKVQYVSFYFDSAYRGNVYLFSYPKSKEWKAELLTVFLKTKEFLFDEDSPHWKGMKKLRYFCLKHLMNSKVERWQSQVQRFLSESD